MPDTARRATSPSLLATTSTANVATGGNATINAVPPVDAAQPRARGWRRCAQVGPSGTAQSLPASKVRR